MSTPMEKDEALALVESLWQDAAKRLDLVDYLQNLRDTRVSFCAKCGIRFVPKRKGMVYCSHSCGDAVSKYRRSVEKGVIKNPRLNVKERVRGGAK